MHAQLTRHLHKLAVEIGCRPIGSPTNQAAADYIRDAFRGLGLAVEEQAYPCTGWECRGAWLYGRSWWVRPIHGHRSIMATSSD